jgi:chromosome segregation ATPase
MAENLILVELKAEGQASVEKEILKVAGAIDTVGEEFENLNNTVDLAKKKLATMKEGSKEFKALQSEIKATEITMKSMGNSTSSLKAELRAMKGEIGNMVNALNQMESAGLGGTEQFRILEQQMLETRARAGELSDTIGDISDEISRSGSDTSGLDKTVGALQAVGGAFQAGIGITALFGSENEDLQKTLVKLNAVMAITSGAQQFFTEALKKDSLLYPIVTAGQKAWTLAIGTSTGALRALRTALASIGIGLIIAGIVLLIKYFYEWGESLTVLSEKQKTLNQLSQDVASNVAKETQSLTGLLAILRDENTTREQKNEALRQIREQYPEYLGQLTLENLKTDEGNKLITKQIELLTRREQVKKLVEQIAELETKIKIKPDVDLSLLEKAEIFLFEGLTSEKKLGETRNKVFEKNIKKQTTALSEEIEKRKALLNELLTADTADALLGERAKKGKGIKSGIDKEVVGAFDALKRKNTKS